MTIQNPNANAQTTGAQQGNQVNVTPPVELTLKRHGREIKVPTEKAVELAQKGLDYEVRTAELSKKEAMLRDDAAAYGEYQQLKTSLESNAKLKQAFLMAMQNPDAVLGATQRQQESYGGDDDAGNQLAAKQANPAADPNLLVEVANLKAKLEQREMTEAKSRIEGDVRSEITQYPWLVNSDGSLNKAGQAAYKAAILTMAHSSETTSAAAALAANEQREILEEIQKQGLRRSDMAEMARQAPMRGGVTSATPPQNLNKKSFDDGSLRNAALEYARKAGLL
jgi:hypothetical protein